MILKDKVCLITGSARGIGYAIAEELAANGAKIVLTDVLEDVLGESVEKLSWLRSTAQRNHSAVLIYS
jgi:NAD(P)-dependent dehydrogenase (short-subunit alcohol dehydrogenase family)